MLINICIFFFSLIFFTVISPLMKEVAKNHYHGITDFCEFLFPAALWSGIKSFWFLPLENAATEKRCIFFSNNFLNTFTNSRWCISAPLTPWKLWSVMTSPSNTPATLSRSWVLTSLLQGCGYISYCWPKLFNEARALGQWHSSVWRPLCHPQMDTTGNGQAFARGN